VARLEMSGDVPPFPINVCMLWKGKILIDLFKKNDLKEWFFESHTLLRGEKNCVSRFNYS
jgi:hypothetical protein